jgi:hypothetical protein
LRRLDELASQATVVKSECFSQYRNACLASTRLGEFTHEATKQLSLYVRARREGSKIESLHQTIYSVTDQYLGISETGMWDGCRKMLNGLLQDITTLAENIMDADITVKGKRIFRAWTIVKACFQILYPSSMNLTSYPTLFLFCVSHSGET